MRKVSGFVAPYADSAFLLRQTGVLRIKKGQMGGALGRSSFQIIIQIVCQFGPGKIRADLYVFQALLIAGAPDIDPAFAVKEICRVRNERKDGGIFIALLDRKSVV